MTDDEPEREVMGFIEGIFAQLFGDDENESSGEQSRQEARELIGRKITTARALWFGDDADAKVARLVFDACEAFLLSVQGPGAISHMLHSGISPILGEAVKAVDRLARLGVARTVAQGRPTPDDIEWLWKDGGT